MSQQDDGPQGGGEAALIPPDRVSQRLHGAYSQMRAEIASGVLAALIANKELCRVFCKDAEDLGTSHYDQAAYHALRHADALIEAMGKPLPPFRGEVRSARPPAWDAPRTETVPARQSGKQAAVAAQAGIEPGQSVPLSDKMVATLTLMMSGEAKPVAAAQAKFFERHGLAVAALGMPAPRRPYRMMEITAQGREALRAKRTGGQP